MIEGMVMVTGAAGRIGFAIAQGILAKGGKVIFVDINKVDLVRITENTDKENILAIFADAGISEEADRCILEGKKRFGRIDAAVHAAYPRSTGFGARFENIQRNHLIEDLSMQLGGSILFSKQIMEFLKTGYGNLIHVSSIMGGNPKI